MTLMGEKNLGKHSEQCNVESGLPGDLSLPTPFNGWDFDMVPRGAALTSFQKVT
jgi:hypothetical protein